MKRASRKPTSAAAGAVHPLLHMADALCEGWHRHRKRETKCRGKFTRKSVHRSRVQTRRLISLLGLLPGLVPAKDLEKTRRLLKRRHAVTRELRDAQVGRKNIMRLTRELPEAAAFAGWLETQGDRFGRRARRALERGKGRRLARLVGSIEMALRRKTTETSAARAIGVIGRNLDRAFERVLQRDERVDPANVATIHRTRVALKRFAYMVEAVDPILRDRSAARLDAMSDAMNAMGGIQDNEVLIAALSRFERKAAGRGPSVLALRAELVRRRSQMIAGYLTARRALAGFRPAESEPGTK